MNRLQRAACTSRIGVGWVDGHRRAAMVGETHQSSPTPRPVPSEGGRGVSQPLREDHHSLIAMSGGSRGARPTLRATSCRSYC